MADVERTVSYSRRSDGEDEVNSNITRSSKIRQKKDHEGNFITTNTTTSESSDNESRKGNKPPPIDIPHTGNNSTGGPKTPTPGPSGTVVTISRHKSEREKKLGHRRVMEGGEVTYKKIQTSQIMGAIQLGIQHAIGGLASKPERDLLMQDFMTVEQTYFPSGGSNQTPAHHFSSDFRFKTYAPIAFRYFRDLFGIQPDDFLMSMCHSPLRELSNPGASGSIFYLTSDDEFIIKTVQHKEGEFLQKLLPGYYMNLNQNPRTLLPKFFGLFCYQCNSKNIRLAVMNNLLPSYVKMHQKYDLKGSTYKRKASKQECQKKNPTYKDLDFIEHHPDGIFLEAGTWSALMTTMQRDCRVLESFKIMDYSFLVGIHNLDIAAKEKAEKKINYIESEEEDDEGDTTQGGGLTRSRSINRQKLVAHSTALESIQAESEPIDADEDVPPGGIPARNAKGERLLLFLGLIDILQSYRLKKKLEHGFKALIHDGDTVSVHRPSFYAERFMNFMSKSVFKKIQSLDLPEYKGPHRKFRNLVSTFLALKHSPSHKKKPPGMRSKLPSDADAYGSPPLATSPLSPPRTSVSSQSHTRKKSSSAAPSEDQNQNPTASSTGGKRVSNGVSKSTSKEGVQRMDSNSNKNNVFMETSLDGPSQSTASQVAQPQQEAKQTSSYPSVLSSKERPCSSMKRNKAEVPPPVPPRTPRKNINNTSVCQRYEIGINSQLILNKKSSIPRYGFGSSAGGWNLNNSELNPHHRYNVPHFQPQPQQQQSNFSSTSTSTGQGSSSISSPTRHYQDQDSEPISISDVYVETKCDVMTHSNISGSSSTTSGVSSSAAQFRSVRSPSAGFTDLNGRNTSATPTWTEGTRSYTESSSSGDLGCPKTPIKGLKTKVLVNSVGENGNGALADDESDENDNEMTHL